MEAAPGVEPGDKGFAILCLTTWLCRHFEKLDQLNIKKNIIVDAAAIKKQQFSFSLILLLDR